MSRETLRAAAVVHWGLSRADGAIVLARPVGKNAPLIDDPGMGELSAGRTDVDVPVAIEDEVLLREAAIGLLRLVPDGHVRGDASIPEPLQELRRTIGGIAGEPLRRQAEAALDALDHGLGDGDLV